jgi:hypothetical protein
MKRNSAIVLSCAAATLALFIPAAIQAQTAAETAEAATMVSARVALIQNVDGSKAKPGDAVQTTLADKVALKNGTVLPAGTKILGVVAADELNLAGTAKLALIFNKAVLKNGTVIPIKATVVGVYAPESQDINGRPIKPGDQFIGDWSGKSTVVDEIGALPGVDLHSRVDSSNSGVLVSTNKHDVKLKWGSELSLAVASQTAPADGTAQGK